MNLKLFQLKKITSNLLLKLRFAEVELKDNNSSDDDIWLHDEDNEMDSLTTGASSMKTSNDFCSGAIKFALNGEKSKAISDPNMHVIKINSNIYFKEKESPIKRTIPVQKKSSSILNFLKDSSSNLIKDVNSDNIDMVENIQI